MTNWLINLLIKKSKLSNTILIVLGIALPFLLITYIDAYFRGDINVFNSWLNCWNSQIYIACDAKLPPNYPVVGLFLTAGLIHKINDIFQIADRSTSDMIFRYCLACFDSLVFLLFIWLASLMRFRFPVVMGFILLAIPSTLVGGALWGQIDGIALFFGLLSIICFIKSWSKTIANQNNSKLYTNFLWLLLGNLAFVLYILTKQLSIFSLPFFFLLYIVTIWKFWQNFNYKGFLYIFIGLIFFFIVFRYVDSLFEIPKQFYNSSYWFVWAGGGSEHGNKISGNGFNIWMFLGRDMWSSSHIPFFTFKLANWKYDFVPYKLGIFLYVIFISFTFFVCFKSVWVILKQKLKSEKTDNYLIALLFLFHGISHLGFNVLLSGTHERYLYLGYPFLLISITWFWTKKIAFSWRFTIFSFFAAFAYGCFVFSIMGPLPELLFPLQRHEFLASIHAFLLIFLLERLIKLYKLSSSAIKLKNIT